jgi:predicted RNase H-like HicB family nuclease
MKYTIDYQVTGAGYEASVKVAEFDYLVGIGDTKEEAKQRCIKKLKTYVENKNNPIESEEVEVA